MIRAIHAVGVLALLGSWVWPAVPDQMTDSDGTAVALWTPAPSTQATLALGPVLALIDYARYQPDPEARGDGDEAFLADVTRRGLVALPEAAGWFGSVALVFALPLGASRRWVRVAGIGVLAAVPVVGWDFVSQARTYPGHFHLGTGGWLLLVGWSLLGACAVQRAATNPSSEVVS